VTVQVFLDRLMTVRETFGVPIPGTRLREPHRVDHKSLKAKLVGKRGALEDTLFFRVRASAIEIKVVRQRGIHIPLGKSWKQLFHDESMQAIAAVVYVAPVTTDERGWDQ